MTPRELAIIQREYLIRTEKQSAVRLSAEFETLKQNINEYLTANLTGRITIARLNENSLLEKILGQLDAQLQRIRNPFTRIVTTGQQRVINFAAESLGKLLVSTIFSPDREAVRKLVGRTQNGSTLARFFDRINPFAREKAREALIDGFALGESPAAIARRMSDVANLARARALTIARTETNEAYRAASREFYVEAEIKEYVWLSALDERTCLICWRLHGQKFASSKKIFSHPNCRCVLVPKTKNAGAIPTGEKLFAKLEPGAQREIVGAKRFELLQSGFKLKDFVDVKKSGEFGDQFLIRNLTDFG